MRDYDFFVIGAGSGGVRAARMAATAGARVGIAENSRLGGTCVNVGCVPKKLMVYASHVSEEIEDAAGYGWQVPRGSFDWATLIANKDKEIARLNDIYRSLLVNAGVDLFEERAELDGPHGVRMASRSVDAERILVATGGWPSMPDIPGIEHAISSNEVFHLGEMPARVAVVGGGYIAVEFAGIFIGLGADVIELYRGEQILRGFDDDVRNVLAAEIRKKGIDLRVATYVTAIEKQADGLALSLTDGSVIVVDQVMFAIGRHPRSQDIGLAEAGVELDQKGAVVVDQFSQTSVPSIYAIGDLTDRISLTPVAIMEAMALVRTLFQGMPTPADHVNVASAVFSQPPIGSVGMTEAQARQALAAVDIYRSSFRPMKHTMTGRSEQTMMKLIVDRTSDRVVGAHMVGPEAGEIIQGIGIAVKMGATKAQFDATIGIHPTAAEEFVTMRDKVSPLAEAAQ